MAKIKEGSFSFGGSPNGAWWSAVFVADDGSVLDGGKDGSGRRYELPPLAPRARAAGHHSPAAARALGKAQTDADVRAAIDIDVTRVLAHYTAQEIV